VLSLSLLSGCKTDEQTSSHRSNSAASSTQSPGQQVYLKSCARCHGGNLQGKGNNPKIDAPKLASLGDQRLRITIASGKGKMPAFGSLSTAQVDALIAYLKSAT
jgi:mono/diheme cytochrome c family protein